MSSLKQNGMLHDLLQEGIAWRTARRGGRPFFPPSPFFPPPPPRPPPPPPPLSPPPRPPLGGRWRDAILAINRLPKVVGQTAPI